MGGIASSVAAIGAAKQSVFGTLPATAVYGHGVAGGQVARIEVEQDRDDITSGSRDYTHVNRTQAVAGFEIETRAFPKSIGLWLLGALGTDGVTGAGPYTHAFTGADTLPYLGIWAKYGADVFTIKDTVIDELTFSWDGPAPLAVALSGIGTVFGFTGTYNPTNDDARQKYLVPAGGTFQLSTNSGTPASARIKAGEIGVANNVEPIVLAGSVVPTDVHAGRREFTSNLTVVPSDLNYWKEVVTGTTGGSTVSEYVIEGSFSCKFVDPSAPAATHLTIAATRVPFMCSFPEANPDGSPAELELQGIPVLPAAGAAVTYTLVNTIATY